MLELVDEVQSLLATERIGRLFRGYDTVESTNTHALAWAAEGAPEGSVVYAEYQSKGRGRQGRSWEAKAGQNLMFSVILRPTFAPDRFPLVTLAGGVAVADGVATACAPLESAIKWPNDVLIEGRKCCGMLLEGTTSTSAGNVVVLGIGLNVNQDAFPEALQPYATSLLLETGRPIPRAPLFCDILTLLEQWYGTIEEDGGRALRQAYSQRLSALGEPITLQVTDNQRPVSGTLLGIDDTGGLRLRTSDGERVFHAGDVTLLTPTDG